MTAGDGHIPDQPGPKPTRISRYGRIESSRRSPGQIGLLAPTTILPSTFESKLAAPGVQVSLHSFPPPDCWVSLCTIRGSRPLSQSSGFRRNEIWHGFSCHPRVKWDTLSTDGPPIVFDDDMGASESGPSFLEICAHGICLVGCRSSPFFGAQHFAFLFHGGILIPVICALPRYRRPTRLSVLMRYLLKLGACPSRWDHCIFRRVPLLRICY